MDYLWSCLPRVVLGGVTLIGVHIWFDIMYLSTGEFLRVLASKTYVIGFFSPFPFLDFSVH